MSVIVWLSVSVRFDIKLFNINFNDETSFLSSQTSSIKDDFIVINLASIALDLAIEFGRFGASCEKAKGVVSKLSIDSGANFWRVSLPFF